MSFAEGFREDPLYCYLIPDESIRTQVLQIFFMIYLNIFSQYGDLLTTSDEFGAIAYVYHQQRFKKAKGHKRTILASVGQSVDFFRYIGIKDMLHMGRSLKTFSSDWIEEYVSGDYIHLDLIAVKEDARKQGKAKQIIEYVVEEARVAQLPLTLETQNPDNVPLYEHFGFEVVCTIEKAHLKQYCMIKQP